VVAVLTTEVVVGRTAIVGRVTALAPNVVGGAVFNLGGTVVGANVVLESAAFLVRGSCGFGVVTVFGVVVVGSAAFLVRGFIDGWVVGLAGTARCACAAPVAAIPPARSARAKVAARTVRLFVMGTD
jgi:hypothetical protein